MRYINKMRRLISSAFSEAYKVIGANFNHFAKGKKMRISEIWEKTVYFWKARGLLSKTRPSRYVLSSPISHLFSFFSLAKKKNCNSFFVVNKAAFQSYLCFCFGVFCFALFCFL